jgi:hypothetical protein
VGLTKLTENGLASLYLSLILTPEHGGSNRPADRVARCFGDKGRCGTAFAFEWNTPSGCLVVVFAPHTVSTPDAIRDRRIHSRGGGMNVRLKAPDGWGRVGALRPDVPPTAIAWCPDHEHRLVDLVNMRDIGRPAAVT